MWLFGWRGREDWSSTWIRVGIIKSLEIVDCPAFPLSLLLQDVETLYDRRFRCRPSQARLRGNRH